MTEQNVSTCSQDGLADPTDERSNCGVGAVVDLDGGRSHSVVSDALDLLSNLEHRGATGAEPNTGDGAGVMVERPDEFFRGVVDDLPETYAVGSVFIPDDDAVHADLEALFERELSERDLEIVTWRDVPTDADAADLGETALDSEPDVRQVFVAPTDDPDDEAFDRRLYVARRAIESAAPEVDGAGRFYVVSLDRRRVVYKGLLTASQLRAYYPDLADDRFTSGVALVHARFSTNTLGAWHLAHPYRNVVHNGEFNTIRGNVNWMRAREGDLSGGGFSEADLDAVTPVVSDPGQSDTASLDETLDLLLHGGRDLPHALRMLVPEAYRGDDAMDDDRRAFYDYHASLIEPWDGPALVLGFDGERVAGVLDRNGLRPCRYDVTTDGRLVMASEAGALEHEPSEVEERGRLQPGETFVADREAGRVLADDEVFADLTADRYGEWVDAEQRDLDAVVDGAEAPPVDGNLRGLQATFGYTTDQLDHLIEPMAESGHDPVGSMGDDTPLSVLSTYDRPLFTYFKQLFAQVSNPPIDYIREELVTSLESRIGPQRNLLDESREHARQVVCDSPILTEAAAAGLRNVGAATDGALNAETLDATFDESEELSAAVADLRERAVAAVEAGADVLVLSDRDVGADRVPVPSLLATGAVHHGLVREGLRARCGLVVDSADPREVHHVACLVGYGADAVCPYLAYETVRDIVAGPEGADEEQAIAAYREALEEGLLKTMAKMGISTVESYQGAQVFEAVGLDSALVGEYFEGTEIRTEGIGLGEVESDLRKRHAVGFGDDPELETQGEYENRSSGLHHGWNRNSVNALHTAVRSGDYDDWGTFAEQVNGGDEPAELRSLLEFDSDRDPVPLDEVEPVSEIVKRFSTAAMSLGSLSPEAHETNAEAMNSIDAKSNTGEGGEPPERFDTERECNVKQVASGRFGVTSEYLTSAEEIQIKMAQGSKPGEGGHLPGEKVNDYIAHVRCSTPGVGLISPPPQHDIYSIEDLKQLIHDLKAANPDADVNVKLVSEAGIGTIAAGVSKAEADVVHVSGHSGGTGASPKTSIKNAGLPWELGLAEANQMLRATGLRDRIRVSVDGGMKTGRDVAVGALLGAEEFAFGTGALVSSGCVMARQCHQNTCPVGIATQREDLRERFPGEPEHVVHFMSHIAQELREIMASLGFRTVEEMVGRPDVLTQAETDHPKAKHLDLSAVLADPAEGARTKVREQAHAAVADSIDWALIEAAQPALEEGEPVTISGDVRNTDRAVGATLSNRVSKTHGGDGLPDGTVTLDFEGTVGQSFGAFLAPGVDARLTGAANDYVGKGLSGGRVVVETPADAAFDPAENTLVGNVALYGATSGEAYVNGVAGERFAVRNSGVKAVVEGVGDHGCEYMTGGVVAVLGDTGRNFAAGMSGGVAYVYDPDDEFEAKVNREMVSTSGDLSEADERMLERLVENHATHTDSERAAALLDDWANAVGDFVRVLPDAYADVIAEGRGADVRDEVPEAADGGDAGAAFERTAASSDD
ncbi:glutamate synthase large subunit [Candidatus Halobonum tyrrellensis]|uniref:Glutamate synthase n=1 Tax=Candidatus Halobonum tyrrellensis G22 TaxID=1324957 RepID=V4GV66_9EURY|nr:glutamate synthase large subunit [Candidatus Halobonum tyrrellensis]ESP89046.1 glutamate synthase [Candidatus Halobonum tyrrellensis G22]